jgi:hypothetical protein
LAPRGRQLSSKLAAQPAAKLAATHLASQLTEVIAKKKSQKKN